MAKTVADVMKMVKENEVKFVDFRFTDTRGNGSTSLCPCRSLTRASLKMVKRLTVLLLLAGKALKPLTCC